MKRQNFYCGYLDLSGLAAVRRELTPAKNVQMLGEEGNPFRQKIEADYVPDILGSSKALIKLQSNLAADLKCLNLSLNEVFRDCVTAQNKGLGK